jgi:hypothetical protein
MIPTPTYSDFGFCFPSRPVGAAQDRLSMTLVKSPVLFFYVVWRILCRAMLARW